MVMQLQPPGWQSQGVQPLQALSAPDPLLDLSSRPTEAEAAQQILMMCVCVCVCGGGGTQCASMFLYFACTVISQMGLLMQVLNLRPEGQSRMGHLTVSPK